MTDTEVRLLRAEIEQLEAQVIVTHNQLEEASGIMERQHAEIDRLRADNAMAADELVEYAKLAAAGTSEQQATITRLQELLTEVKSCGHWSDCPAGVSEKYRCRCAYGIIVEAGI